MGRCSKTMMKQVITVAEKGTGLVEAVSSVEFCVRDHCQWENFARGV
jgi:hypothetical protein